jgi:hypothetical protein
MTERARDWDYWEPVTREDWATDDAWFEHLDDLKKGLPAEETKSPREARTPTNHPKGPERA